MQSLKDLLASINHLGLINGWRYWKISRYFLSRPKEYAEFIFEAKKQAILQKDNIMVEWLNLCQKALDEWNKKRKIKP